MCQNPSKIADVGLVSCRKCWQCRQNRVNDWVGRNIAESKTAKASHVVTLTYGNDLSTNSPDNLRAVVLTYSDVQNYIKRLRSDGFPCRYFAVGEYGSLKGRAHWHIIMYWLDRVPEHRLRENFEAKHWKHGWSFWDDMSPESARYVCKYLNKETLLDDASQGVGPIPSRKPPLGDAYFRELALRYVEQGLAPQDLFYSFPEVRAGGKPVQFQIGGTSARNFCQYFLDGWDKAFPDRGWPNSPLLQAFEHKKLEAYIERVAQPQFQRRGYVPRPSKPPYDGAKVYWSEKHNCFYADGDLGRLWFSYDQEGDLDWHEKIAPNRHEAIRAWEKQVPSLGALYKSAKGEA